MKLKHGELNITTEDPFKEDQLDRHEFIEPLTNLVDSADGPFVLAINGEWGQGKSTFLKMWEQFLINHGYTTLYFNAWENDFVEDPLIAFVGELHTAIETFSNGKRKGPIKKKLNDAMKLSIKVAKRVAPVGAKLLTAGLITEEISSEFQQLLTEFAGEIVSDKIKHYDDDKKTVAAFRKSLEDLAASLPAVHDEKHPIVFFIDELDRCRPTFAVQLLERIKHLFSVNGIVFVLGVDMQQLGYSIKMLYGVGMNADGYLRRFIDLEFTLPNPPLYKFPEFLVRRFGFDHFFDSRPNQAEDEKTVFKETFSALASTMNMTLREQEQCFTRLSVILRTVPPNEDLHLILLVTLLILKVKNVGLYTKLRTGSGYSTDEILNQFRASKTGSDFISSKLGIALSVYLQAAFASQVETYKLMEGLYSNNPKRQQIALFILKRVAAHAPIVPKLVDRIELSERFR